MTYTHSYFPRHKNNDSINAGETLLWVLSFGIPATGHVTDTHILEGSFLGEDLDDDGSRVVRLYVDNGPGLPATCVLAFLAEDLLYTAAVGTVAEAREAASFQQFLGDLTTGALSNLAGFVPFAELDDKPEGEPVRELPKPAEPSTLADLVLGSDHDVPWAELSDQERRVWEDLTRKLNHQDQHDDGDGPVDAGPDAEADVSELIDMAAECEAYSDHCAAPKYRAWLPPGVVPLPGVTFALDETGHYVPAPLPAATEPPVDHGDQGSDADEVSDWRSAWDEDEPADPFGEHL